MRSPPAVLRGLDARRLPARQASASGVYGIVSQSRLARATPCPVRRRSWSQSICNVKQLLSWRTRGMVMVNLQRCWPPSVRLSAAPARKVQPRRPSRRRIALGSCASRSAHRYVPCTVPRYSTSVQRKEEVIIQSNTPSSYFSSNPSSLSNPQLLSNTLMTYSLFTPRSQKSDSPHFCCR